MVNANSEFIQVERFVKHIQKIQNGCGFRAAQNVTRVIRIPETLTPLYLFWYERTKDPCIVSTICSLFFYSMMEGTSHTTRIFDWASIFLGCGLWTELKKSFVNNLDHLSSSAVERKDVCTGVYRLFSWCHLRRIAFSNRFARKKTMNWLRFPLSLIKALLKSFLVLGSSDMLRIEKGILPTENVQIRSNR